MSSTDSAWKPTGWDAHEWEKFLEWYVQKESEDFRAGIAQFAENKATVGRLERERREKD